MLDIVFLYKKWYTLKENNIRWCFYLAVSEENSRINVKFTKEEKIILQELAKRKGISLSKLIANIVKNSSDFKDFPNKK